MVALPLSHVAALLAATAAMAAAAEKAPAPVHRFLDINCVDCHDAGEKKAGLDLTALGFDLRDPAVFSRWAQVLERVEAGEMPPKKRERPEAGELRAFIGELNRTLHATDAARIARDGRVPARRLTRFEYERSLHDLLGTDVPLVDLLPEDARADGFDTVSSAQQVSHHLLEKYLAAIDVALDATFTRAFAPVAAQRIELRWPELQRLRPGGREPGPRTAQQDVVAWAVTTAFHGRMPSTRVTQSGWYRVTLRVAAVNPPPEGEVWCSVRSGVCFAIAPTLYWVGDFAATAQEREHSFEAWIQAGHMIEVRPHDTALKRGRFGTVVPTAEAERTGIPGVALKAVTLERIHRGPEPVALRERLFGGLKVQSVAETNAGADVANERPARKRTFISTTPGLTSTLVSATPDADAARLVQGFASRAFRRPVSAAEAAPYVALARTALAEGATLLDALRGAYRAVLSSPRFLYLEEKPGRLDDHALATRLGYFLWSTVPDDELRRLADAGKLSDPATLRAQVDRMLRHPKAAAFVENFTGQWLNLTDIDFTVPDAKLYPEFDEVVKHAMLAETRAYFRELVERDLGVSHVVDSSFGFMNSRLARHYDVRWPGGEGLQRVAFRPEDHRGGLITQGSVLKVTANGTSTSPVIRGVWMLERIMGVHVPPVPADVPALEPDIRGAKTIREQLDKHRTVESCASCHVKIDPPGFALESYDVTGAWRDRYRVAREGGKGFEHGPAVDPSYTMADGRHFADIAEFKRLLLADQDQLARALAGKLATYATGAGISFADRATIDQIIAGTRPQGHGVRSLIHGVVQSSIFLNK